MNLWMKLTGLLALMVLVLISVGCSQSGISPDLEPAIPKFQELRAEDYANHNLWGMWEITYNLEELSATVTPIRDLQAHFNITGMLLPPNCGDCVKVQVNSFNPATRILNLDVTLKNNTQIIGRDVRGILYTDDYGHLLTNSSAWTGLYDIVGGDDINPFIAFAQNEPNRKFNPGFVDTQNYLISIPNPPMFGSIKYAVDASWPGNCKEPFAIPSAFVNQGPILATLGSSGNLQVSVRDWQNDVGPVYLSAPQITGEELTELSPGGYNAWNVEIINQMGAPAGNYQTRVTAYSANSPGLALYKYIDIVITQVPEESVNLTPPWYFCHPNDVSCPGDGYAYTATAQNGHDEAGLDIFDISDPANPVWVNSVPHYAPGYLYLNIVAANGYAYLNGSGGDFEIIDVAPPADAHSVTIIETAENSNELALDGGYCYVTEGPNLKIIDVDPPDQAHIALDVPIPFSIQSLSIESNNVYLPDIDGYQIAIVDISNPEGAYISGYIATTFPLSDSFKVVNNILYMSLFGAPSDLKILDISSPDAPVEVGSLSLPRMPYDMDYSSGYLATVNLEGVNIIDVSPPADAHIVASFPCYYDINALDIEGGIMCVGGTLTGLQVYNVTVPESAYLAGSFIAADDGPFALDNGLLYSPSFSITSPSPVGSFKVLSRVLLISNVEPDPAFKNSYAYICLSGGDVAMNGIMVMDCSDPQAPSVADTLELPNGVQPNGIVLQGNYAFVPQYDEGLKIIDISDPENIYVAKTLVLTEPAVHVSLDSEYAYVASFPTLNVVDINPVMDAHLVYTLPDDSMDIYDLDMEGDYLYLADSNYGLRIVDKSQPESAQIVKSIPLYNTWHCDVIDGKAYVFDDVGLRVIDVTQPESAYQVSSFNIVGGTGILFIDGLAYITGTWGGLIYDLS